MFAEILSRSCSGVFVHEHNSSGWTKVYENPVGEAMDGEQLSELFEQLPFQWQAVLNEKCATRIQPVIRGVVLSVQVIPLPDNRVATFLDPPRVSPRQSFSMDAHANSPDMYFGVRIADGSIVYCNQALADMLEDDVDEITGLYWEDLFHVDAQQAARQSWRRFLIEGRLERVVLGLNLLNDVPLQVSGSGRGEFVDGQLETGWFVMRDRTAWTALESRLFQSGRLDALGRMTSGIVHDFNNFLQVLLVYANFLVYHHDLDEAALEDAKRVFDASEKAGRLTSRLLAFTQQRFGTPALVDLNTIVDGMALLMRKVLPEGVEIQYSLGEKLEAVYVCPALVEQVMANFLLTAGDVLRSNGVVEVVTEMVDEQDAFVRYRISASPGTYTVLRVSTVGAEEDSGEDSVVRTAPSIDLDNIGVTARDHGGQIRVERSDQGQVTLWLYLPNALVDDPDPTPEGATRREMGGSELLLIVEDDALVRWTIQRMLKAYGYSVLAAANAREAIGIIRREKLALMITDVVMPEMDGPTLVKRAREIVTSLPVLLISGYAEQQVLTEALLDERTAFLPKPFLPNQLAIAVRKVLETAK